jgi:thioredoxin 1
MYTKTLPIGNLRDNDLINGNVWSSWMPHRILLYFYSTDCVPCKAFSPVYGENAERFHKVGFFTVDAMENPSLCSHFKILSLPTVVFLENGNEVQRKTGSANLKDFKTSVQTFDVEND